MSLLYSMSSLIIITILTCVLAGSGSESSKPRYKYIPVLYDRQHHPNVPNMSLEQFNQMMIELKVPSFQQDEEYGTSSDGKPHISLPCFNKWMIKKNVPGFRPMPYLDSRNGVPVKYIPVEFEFPVEHRHLFLNVDEHGNEYAVAEDGIIMKPAQQGSGQKQKEAEGKGRDFGNDGSSSSSSSSSASGSEEGRPKHDDGPTRADFEKLNPMIMQSIKNASLADIHPDIYTGQEADVDTRSGKSLVMILYNPDLRPEIATMTSLQFTYYLAGWSKNSTKTAQPTLTTQARDHLQYLPVDTSGRLKLKRNCYVNPPESPGGKEVIVAVDFDQVANSVKDHTQTHEVVRQSSSGQKQKGIKLSATAAEFRPASIRSTESTVDDVVHDWDEVASRYLQFMKWMKLYPALTWDLIHSRRYESQQMYSRPDELAESELDRTLTLLIQSCFPDWVPPPDPSSLNSPDHPSSSNSPNGPSSSSSPAINSNSLPVDEHSLSPESDSGSVVAPGQVFAAHPGPNLRPGQSHFPGQNPVPVDQYSLNANWVSRPQSNGPPMIQPPPLPQAPVMPGSGVYHPNPFSNHYGPNYGQSHANHSGKNYKNPLPIDQNPANADSRPVVAQGPPPSFPPQNWSNHHRGQGHGNYPIQPMMMPGMFPAYPTEQPPVRVVLSPEQILQQQFYYQHWLEQQRQFQQQFPAGPPMMYGNGPPNPMFWRQSPTQPPTPQVRARPGSGNTIPNDPVPSTNHCQSGPRDRGDMNRSDRRRR